MLKPGQLHPSDAPAGEHRQPLTEAECDDRVMRVVGSTGASVSAILLSICHEEIITFESRTDGMIGASDCLAQVDMLYAKIRLRIKAEYPVEFEFYERNFTRASPVDDSTALTPADPRYWHARHLGKIGA